MRVVFFLIALTYTFFASFAEGSLVDNTQTNTQANTQTKVIKSLPVTLDLKAFAESPLFENQKSLYPSFSTEPEYAIYKNNDKDVFKFKGWARYDSVDKKGTYFDIRELSYTKVFKNGLNLVAGVSKVFWGTAESVHLVDIVNQNDDVEPARSYAKMGQPMFSIGINRPLGNVKYFVLPYFRERNFKGSKGRPWIGVDESQPIYQSSNKERHIDHALRYTNYFGPIDFGLSHFYGTSREPVFQIEFNQNGSIKSFTPYYQIINQTGLDLQYTMDSLLLKTEVIYRTSKDDKFFASTSGFEYTFFNILSKGYDIGFLSEYTKDNRNLQKSPITIFQDDIFVGSRLALNDTQGTEVLAGVYFDRIYDTKIFSLELKRRIKENVKIEVFANINNSKNREDFAFFQRRDTSLNVKLTHFI